MDSASAALWALVVTLLGSAVTVIPPLFALLRDRIDSERARIRREAGFDAAMLVEENARRFPMSGETKLARAVEIANARTSDRVRVTPEDVQTQLPRVRASLPSTSVAPLPIPVTVVSSVPPDDAAAATPTLPRPAPLPRDTSREKAPIR